MAASGKKFFYGWWIVFGGFFLTFASMGVALNCFSLFIKPVSEALGFGRGDFSNTFTIGALAIMIGAPFIAKLYERYDARWLVGLSAVLMSGSYFSFAYSSTLVQFYVGSVFMGLGVAGTTLIAVSVLITNWFTTRRGLALGIALSASGLGTLIYSPLGDWFLSKYGWQNTFTFFAVSIAALTIPPALLMRSRPSDLGLRPYGESSEAAGMVPANESGMTLLESMKTLAFWMLALMTLLSSLEVQGIQMHLIPYFQQVGHDSSFAAWTYAGTMGALILTKTLVGQLIDRAGLLKSLILVFLANLVAILLLFYARNSWIAVIAGLLFSVGLTIQTVVPPLMTAACVGLKHFGVVFGVINVFMTVGAGLGMSISGYFFDAYKSYHPVYRLYLGMTVVAAIMGFLSLRSSRLAARRG